MSRTKIFTKTPDYIDCKAHKLIDFNADFFEPKYFWYAENNIQKKIATSHTHKNLNWKLIRHFCPLGSCKINK